VIAALPNVAGAISSASVIRSYAASQNVIESFNACTSSAFDASFS
jgi:hypothetical protein